jgi:hypothetical protein
MEKIAQDAKAFADAETGHHIRFALSNPAWVYDSTRNVGVWVATDYALTITRIDLTLDAVPAAEVLADLCYANALVGLADSVVISSLDTVRGVFAATDLHVDVPEGRCIYFQFRARPHPAIGQILCQVDYRRA